MAPAPISLKLERGGGGGGWGRSHTRTSPAAPRGVHAHTHKHNAVPTNTDSKTSSKHTHKHTDYGRTARHIDMHTDSQIDSQLHKHNPAAPYDKGWDQNQSLVNAMTTTRGSFFHRLKGIKLDPKGHLPSARWWSVAHCRARLDMQAYRTRPRRCIRPLMSPLDLVSALRAEKYCTLDDWIMHPVRTESTARRLIGTAATWPSTAF